MAKWTEPQEFELAQLIASGATREEIMSATGRSYGAVDSKISKLKRKSAADSRQEIRKASLAPPVNPDDYAALTKRMREIEAENARLREQKKWETHADTEALTGGLMTLRDSDRHTSDEQHLLACCASLEEKFCVLVQRYEPDRIQYVGMDDFIAGRGIFKNQDLQSAVTDPMDQLKVGAVVARRFFTKIRAVTKAPIQVEWLRGNHEYVQGASVAEAFYDKTVLLCQDIPDLRFRYNGDRVIINLASEGWHNALFMHGFGHSNNSPNSPRFVDTAKDIMLEVQRNRPPEQHIKRVGSGHTHWADEGMERIVGVAFDTTGGLQRNNRVQLGMNQRPLGWLAYISPRGATDILRPIMLQPEQDTLQRERSDPSLPAANRVWCAECLLEYDAVMRDRGMLAQSDEFGVTQGRW